MKQKKELQKKTKMENKKILPSTKGFSQPFTTVVRDEKSEKLVAKNSDENEWPTLEWKRYLRSTRKSRSEDLLENPEAVNTVLSDEYLGLWYRSTKTRTNSKDVQSLRKLLPLFSPEQRQILNLRYCEGLSLLQLSERLGVSYQAIQNRFKKMAKKIAKHVDSSANQPNVSAKSVQPEDQDFKKIFLIGL